MYLGTRQHVSVRFLSVGRNGQSIPKHLLSLALRKFVYAHVPVVRERHPMACAVSRGGVSAFVPRGAHREAPVVGVHAAHYERVGLVLRVADSARDCLGARVEAALLRAVDREHRVVGRVVRRPRRHYCAEAVRNDMSGPCLGGLPEYLLAHSRLADISVHRARDVREVTHPDRHPRA